MRARILVVDDDPDIRSLITFALQQDFDVETAFDGQRAIEMLAEQPGHFAAMVLDLSMPRKTGFEVLEHISADRATESLPVLVLTARTDRDAKVDAYVGGGHVFVAKPFDPDHLVVAVHTLVRRSASGRQVDRLEKLMNLTD